ncbi:MAG: dihydroneopterin aldolase, partial [Selenomonas sp.]|nr:dihydroneopterin aldolase [Selenomonas sp.]
MDKIKLTGLNFYGYHGCLPEERQMGQEFGVDVSMYLDLQEAGETDKLA